MSEKELNLFSLALFLLAIGGSVLLGHFPRFPFFVYSIMVFKMLPTSALNSLCKQTEHLVHGVEILIQSLPLTNTWKNIWGNFSLSF